MALALPTIFHLLSIVISLIVLGLSTVNFGVLCIWINSSASFLTFGYNAIILLLNWRRHLRSTAAPSTHEFEEDSKNPSQYADVVDFKIPTYPSPTYSPPPYHQAELIPNRNFPRPLLLTAPRPTRAKEDDLPSSTPFYALGSFFCVIVLTILTVVGFGMTVELSVRGAKSLLPAERLTMPWSMNIQKAQCTFLGAQMLLNFIVLALCAIGRRRISNIEREKREEVEYGLASPVVSHPHIRWAV